ncbi:MULTISPECIES: SigB/SigF/SigG family RNA polymerase sigma factor [unclassified Streptomyces]|uniref:SigB/SigF/SigG family RNA polymerase sigma factor n=1 Tax=unclassified Streptomyces TaxID=2593676 RepID=UPI0038122A38
MPVSARTASPAIPGDDSGTGTEDARGEGGSGRDGRLIHSAREAADGHDGREPAGDAKDTAAPGAQDGHAAPEAGEPQDGGSGPDGTGRPVGRPGGTRSGTTNTNAIEARALTQVLFEQLTGLEPGTPDHARVRAALIEVNLPLVRYAAARFRSRNEPMEDVVQVGTIGLINAIDRFDPERGVQFPTFAMPTVVGEIKRYFRDNVRTVHVPRRLHELWVQVSGAIEDLTVAHGRTPTTAEIADRLKLSEDEVLACLEAGRAYHATSLEAAQEGGEGSPGLLDRLGYEDPALTGVEHRDLVRHLLVQLPERERRILLLRYFGNLTQSQISAELGVSQMHVSRLLSRSFARLRSANQLES